MIVDDHQMVVQALMLALSREPDIDVVATAATVREAVQQAERVHPDLVLVDYYLPDGTGADAVRAMVEARSGTSSPEPKFVFLSADRSDSAVLSALEAGASGYLIKSDPLDQLVAAVRRAGEGEILLQQTELVALLGRQRELQRQKSEQQRVESGFTDREREILDLMAAGLDNRTIANRLHLALSTVRWYVQILLEKLEVHSKLGAVAKAAELGLIQR
ncbi:MAG: response regulator transcription factor [Actinobacteria bacterium]|nr:response regulator transcription factor [Candidatus Dormibacteraeota bacterium]MBO0837926.1 response regulator transcription factor [Actinomycetota bacterium]